MEREYLYDKNSGNSFINKIRYRLFKQNKNWLGIVCGDTGSGKSYSAISFADAVVPRGITIKRNVVFNPIQFLEKINDGTLQKGDIVIFDEAGVGMSSRDWYSLQNKLLGSVLQTFRNMNVGVIFTTPNLSFIDVQARKLFHNYFETSHIDYEKCLATLKVYNIQHNSRMDKTYYKSPLVMLNGVQHRAPFITLPKPRPYLVKEYEAVKSAYTEELNKKALEELKQADKTATKDNRAAENKAIQSLSKDHKQYLKKRANRLYLDIDLIQTDYNLSRPQASRVKKQLEKNL